MTAPPRAWQRVYSAVEGEHLAANDVDPLLGGLPDVVNGFVTVAADLASVQSPLDYFDSLRLDYPGSLFRRGDPIYVARFTLVGLAKIAIPDKPLASSLGKDGGVDLGYAPPFYTGNGFVGTRERVVPEYWVVEGEMNPGAEMWRISTDRGSELFAVLGKNKEWLRVVSQ